MEKGYIEELLILFMSNVIRKSDFFQEFIRPCMMENALGKKFDAYREQFILNKADLSGKLRSDYAPYRFTHFYADDSLLESSVCFDVRISRVMINVDEKEGRIVSVGMLVDANATLLDTIITRLGQPFRKFGIRMPVSPDTRDEPNYTTFYWKIDGYEIMLNLFKSSFAELKGLKMKPLIMFFEKNAKTVEFE